MSRRPLLTRLQIWSLALGLTALLAGVVAGAMTGCSGPEAGGQAGQAGQADRAGAETLPTVHAERRTFTRTVSWFGTVESRHAVRVVALEAGRVVAVEAADGGTVTRGEPLFRLGGPAAERRQATLGQRVASLEQQLRLAGATVTRRRQALAEKLVRRDELLAAEGDQARLQNELAAARQDLADLESALDLRAPASGTFTDRQVAVGQDVAAGDVLGRIVDAGSLRVVASLYPGDGDVAGGPGSDLDGAPVAFDGVAPPAESGAAIVRVLPDRSAAGALTVWIEGGPLDSAIPPAGAAPRWGPGEAVSGTVRLATHEGAVAVPEAAVVRDEQDRPFVFVPRPAGSEGLVTNGGQDGVSDRGQAGNEAGGGDGGYVKRAITTGLSADGWVEVTSGLDAGTAVVSEGAYELLFRDFGSIYQVPD